jgi:hypothetical protein
MRGLLADLRVKQTCRPVERRLMARQFTVRQRAINAGTENLAISMTAVPTRMARATRTGCGSALLRPQG